jgi:hypothetical protein
MKTRGTWPLVQDWYSICSSHRDHREDCPRCNVGSWNYRLAARAGHLLYKASPALWRLWANRPAGRARLHELLKKIRGSG